jgi:metal-sulfur cluster biosynthetic enzyme
MAEPSMSESPDPGTAPSPAATAAPPLHDRELPVTPAAGDAGQHPTPRTGAAESTPTEGEGAEGAAADALTEDQVKIALRRVKDPELNLNILDLGLVYAIRVEGTAVSIDMSLTSPGCPSGPEIMTDAERHLRAIPGVTDVKVNLVWDPFWSPDRIEPRVRAYLGF